MPNSSKNTQIRETDPIKQNLTHAGLRIPRKLIRLTVIAGLAWLIFYFIFPPMIIHGASMMPTFPENGFLFSFRPMFLFREMKRGDVVILRYAGDQLYLLKRVLAFEGETVSFSEGKLYINGKAADEPYVKYKCDWILSPRVVPKGKIFVMGDNRSMEIERHTGGMIDRSRVQGVPLWKMN